MKNKDKMIREFSKIRQEAVEKCGEDIVNKLVSSLSNIYEHEIICVREKMQEELDNAYETMREIHNSNFTLSLENQKIKDARRVELYEMKLI